LDSLLNDIRFTVRTWLRNPGFTAVAVVTLALGIGANTTMFSVVNATLLRTLPFPRAARLMTLWKSPFNNPDRLNIVSLPNFRDYQAQNHTFESLALVDSAGRGYNLTGEGEAEQVSGVRVTASFFTVFGVQPLVGRTFSPEEETAGRDRVVVLSHALWTRRYASDPSIVGKTIQMDARAYTVIGVMPATFRFQFGGSTERQLWVPAGWTKGDEERGSNSFYAIGRLKDGVTFNEARSEMDTIGRALANAYPDDNAGQTVRLVPMTELGIARLRPTLVAMLGVVGFVLLIACVNVANLTLARAASRSRELAIRCALGAARGRIVRQLLTESVMLACAGGVGGVLLAYWGTTALLPILPSNLRGVPLRPVDRIGIDMTVLAFTSCVSIASGILFGLAPALGSSRDLIHPMKESAPGSTGGRGRLRYVLVASEVALTLVVLAGAGVMLLSVSRLLAVDPGLDTRNVLVMQMSLPQENLYYGPPGNPRFCDSLDQRAGSVPGVRSVSAIAHLPLSGGSAGRGITIEGRPDPGPENQGGAAYSVACPNVLRTLGMTLRSGREFNQRDALDAPPVAMINEAMARRNWPGEDAVGKRFKIGLFGSDAPWMTVVGVFKDVRQFGLDTDPGPWFLRPYQQAAWPFMSIIVKTASVPASFVAPVKQALAIVEPNQPVSGVRTMEDVVGTSVSSRRFPMLLLTLFGLLALVLAAVGIAGVVGYSVVRRTQEIGLRMALGAQRRDVLRLVLSQSLVWTAVGIVVGLAAAFGLLRFLDTLLYGIKPADPMVLGSASILLVVVALSASYLPARRAMGIDAVRALREG
jgi:putative ABC transport system permease protein